MKRYSLIISLFVVAIGQAIYIFFLSDQQLDKIDNLPAETESISATADNSPRLKFSIPVCNIKSRPFSLLDNVPHAALVIGDQNLTVRKGQHINNHILVDSITDEGVVLIHRSFKQYLPFDFALRNLQGDKGIDNSNIHQPAFPDADNNLGLVKAQVSGQYQDKIKVLSDNVLQIKRAFFYQLLATRESLENVSFALSSKGGFQLTRLDEQSPFVSMGMKTGDIVKSVNNRELKAVSDLVSTYQQLEQINLLELQLERQGQDLYLYYQLTD